MKAQGISINTIIIAAIALLVLVVLSFIFIAKGVNISESFCGQCVKCFAGNPHCTNWTDECNERCFCEEYVYKEFELPLGMVMMGGSRPTTRVRPKYFAFIDSEMIGVIMDTNESLNEDNNASYYVEGVKMKFVENQKECTKAREKTECEKGNPSYIAETFNNSNQTWYECKNWCQNVLDKCVEDLDLEFCLDQKYDCNIACEPLPLEIEQVTNCREITIMDATCDQLREAIFFHENIKLGNSYLGMSNVISAFRAKGCKI